MTHEECIEQLEIAKSLIVQSGEDWLDERDLPILEMAIESLKKQVPMKIKLTTSTKRCGRCNRQLSGIGNLHPERNYCQGCGQAILWE